jgi:hypothetical protein
LVQNKNGCIGPQWLPYSKEKDQKRWFPNKALQSSRFMSMSVKGLAKTLQYKSLTKTFTPGLVSYFRIERGETNVISKERKESVVIWEIF